MEYGTRVRPEGRSVAEQEIYGLHLTLISRSTLKEPIIFPQSRAGWSLYSCLADLTLV
jgi:hypothetical protein